MDSQARAAGRVCRGTLCLSPILEAQVRNPRELSRIADELMRLDAFFASRDQRSGITPLSDDLVLSETRG